MPLDTNIALQAKLPQIDGPLDVYAKGQQLQSLMNQGRMQDMQMKGLMRQQQEEDDIKSAYANAADPESRLQALMKVSPKAYQGEAKFQNEQQKTQMDNAKTQAETQKMHLDFTNQAARDLASNPSDENIKSWAVLAVRNGVMDMNHATALINHVSGLPPLERSQVFAGMGANAEQKLKQFTPDLKPVNLGGATKFVDQNSMTNPGLGGQSFAHTATPDAILSSNTSRENSIRTDNRMRDPSVKLTHGVQGLTPEQNEALFGENGAVTTGRLDPGRINSRTASILADGFIKNPTANFSDISAGIKAQTAAVKSFATGKDGQVVQSANTALNHLDTLAQLAQAQNNGDMRLFNQLANKFATQTGGAAPTNLAGAISLVGPEITKAVVGAGGGVTDREHVRDALKAISDGGPAQASGQIATMKELFGGRLTEAQRTYERSTKRKDFADTFLSPSAKSVLESRTGNPKSNAPQQIKSDADFNALPSGAEFIAPDGSHRRKP